MRSLISTAVIAGSLVGALAVAAPASARPYHHWHHGYHHDWHDHHRHWHRR